jgi:hypothetical protein
LTGLTASAVNPGLNALLGAARTAVAARGDARFSDDDLRNAGFTQAQIDDMKAQFEKLRNRAANFPEEAREAAQDPRKAAAWWTFTGIVLSMAAAVGGAVLGAGPNLVITSFRIRAAAPAVVATPPRCRKPRSAEPAAANG